MKNFKCRLIKMKFLCVYRSLAHNHTTMLSNYESAFNHGCSCNTFFSISIYLQLKSFHENKQTNKHVNFSLFQFIYFSALSLVSVADGEDMMMDTREGENISLKCRFSEQHNTNEFSYYWAHIGTKYDNVAIGPNPLASNYR